MHKIGATVHIIDIAISAFFRPKISHRMPAKAEPINAPKIMQALTKPIKILLKS
jgi:hypothetical protein